MISKPINYSISSGDFVLSRRAVPYAKTSFKSFIIASIIFHVVLISFFKKWDVTQCPIAGKVIEVSILNIAPPAPPKAIQKNISQANISQANAKILPKQKTEIAQQPQKNKSYNNPVQNIVSKSTPSSQKPAIQPTQKTFSSSPVATQKLAPQPTYQQPTTQTNYSQQTTNYIQSESYSATKLPTPLAQSTSSQAATNAPAIGYSVPNIIQNPIIISQPQPNYPPMALKRNQQGVVYIQAIVDKLGNTQNIQIFKSSGFSLLDQAAIESVKNWKFEVSAYAQYAQNIVRVPVKFLIN